MLSHGSPSLYDEVSGALGGEGSDNFAVLMNATMTDASVLVDLNALSKVTDAFDSAVMASPTAEGYSLDYEYKYSDLEQFTNVSPADDWKVKYISYWTGSDTMQWLIDAAQSNGISPAELPLYMFRETTGQSLMRLSKDDFCNAIQYATTDLSPYIGDILYESLQKRIHNVTGYDQHYGEAVVPVPVIDKFEMDSMPLAICNGQDTKTFYDLDKTSFDYNGSYHTSTNFDSDYDSINEDSVIHSDRRSPASKQASESDSERSVDLLSVTVPVKRPPGRPKGSGKKLHKRVKNVSVPEFLRDLLLNPKYCPRIIKWEDYSIGKFRFVRADEVARLWGGKRNNAKMSFEKFSRAMRYHYKQGVLVSVPTARLVYQFGPKAPVYSTEDPNFEVASSTSGS